MKIKHIFSVFITVVVIYSCFRGIKSVAASSLPLKTGFFHAGEMTMDKTYPLDSITTLANGDVLLTKGSEAELYYAQKKKYKKLGTHEIMQDVSTIALNDGRVLLIGRSVNPIGIKSINRYFFEEFNPHTQKFKVLLQIDDFYFPTKNAIKLLNGNIFLQGNTEAYVYDVKENKLSEKIQYYDPELRYFNEYETAIAMNDLGKVFIFGMGYCKKTDPEKVRKYVFKYDPDTNKITLHGKLQVQRLGNIRAYTLNHNEIAVFGGKDNSGSEAQSITSYEIYDIYTGKSKLAGTFPLFINKFLRTELTYDGKIITNMPYGTYKNTYKPYVFDMNMQIEESARGSYGTGIDIHNASITRLTDGCYLYAGGYDQRGLDSKKTYKYCH